MDRQRVALLSHGQFPEREPDHSANELASFPMLNPQVDRHQVEVWSREGHVGG